MNSLVECSEQKNICEVLETRLYCWDLLWLYCEYCLCLGLCRVDHKYHKYSLIMGRWQSGQLHQTVNLTPHGYAGSNPALPKLGLLAHLASPAMLRGCTQELKVQEKKPRHGPLAHLARAPALHAGGDEFDSRRVQIWNQKLLNAHLASPAILRGCTQEVTSPEGRGKFDSRRVQIFVSLLFESP